MSPPKLILCERTPRWLAAWRLALPDSRWSLLSSAVSLAQCETQLQESPESVAAVHVNEQNLSTVIPILHRWRRDFPAARFLALCSSDVAQKVPAVALLQDAGVLLVIDRLEQLPAATRLVQRHLRRHVATSTALPTTIWQRIPWPRFAVSTTPVIN
ncbi:hypothetical protein ETAA8_51310 [Anatilimnocola aggregata]|uniref:Uncharacterized protein n=1 Tax=Anatilimnocola aggregata TaxID=2528021 RepID=A0A517YIF5_9BACT|nr:hypothetical protein [Anatilimnocola aggregata]QDU30013.1 hypothetical protein ETAA8_51310 [Anatilimnocola aggregata]